MINTLKRATKLAPWLSVAAILATAAPALAQAPSQAQRDAIKSQCRSDYIAHCSSVPPGGEASLQCLQKNMSSLSSGCQGAVRTVAAPAAAAPAAAPKTDAAPAAAGVGPNELLMVTVDELEQLPFAIVHLKTYTPPGTKPVTVVEGDAGLVITYPAGPLT